MEQAIRIKINSDTQFYFKVLEKELSNIIDSTLVRQLALAYGIKYYPRKIDSNNSEKNKQRETEIRSNYLVNPVFDSIIRSKNYDLENKKKKTLYEDYLEYGAKLLYDKFQKNENNDNFLLCLIDDDIDIHFGNTEDNIGEELRSINPEEIKICIGLDEEEKEVHIKFNSIANAGYNMGIVGTTGSGKTQISLKISSQVHEKSPNTNIIFLDYGKGDVATNEKYINDINATVINALTDGISFNPFNIKDISDVRIEELKELICSNQARIGANQRMELFVVLKKCYDKYEHVTFDVVYKELIEFYREQGKESNVLVELFHKIVISNIFRNKSDEDMISSFLKDNMIIDLHNIDSTMSIKEIVAFFILHKIHTEAINLPDSKINKETGVREIRTMILLDEGYNYLNAKNPILQKMLRELRSKGISVVIITQSFNDFDTQEFDYSEMMNWVIVMKSHISAKDIQKSLCTSLESSKKLQLEIPNMPPLSLYMRGLEKNEELPMIIKSGSYND